MSSWYRSSRSLMGCARLRRSWPEQLADFPKTLEERVHVLERVVQREGCPHARRDAEMVHHGHRTVMPRAHGDALLVEHGAHFVRMDTVERERQDGGLLTCGAEQLQPRDFSRPKCGLAEKRGLMPGDD